MQERNDGPRTIGQPPQATPPPPYVPQPPTRPRRMSTGLVAAVAALGLALGIGGTYLATHATGNHTSVPVPALTSALLKQPATFTLTGSFTLKLGGFERLTETTCTGYDGFNDIQGGTTVVVTDQTGTTIATGELSPGVAQMTNGSPYGCEFLISVPNVPGDRTFYGVEVSHRGKQTFSDSDAKSGQIALTLG